MKAVVVAQDLVTAYGWGIEASWSGLASGRTAISPVTRFGTAPFQAHSAATLAGLDPSLPESLAGQLLNPLLERAAGTVPPDALLILASTTGEIDLLERAVASQTGDAAESRLDRFLAKAAMRSGVRGGGLVISAACASSTAALAHAAGLIRSGRRDAVLVAACDSVTEFVFSGFSSLMALDPEGARPFDARRHGLTVGEAAACALVMSDERARREQRTVLWEVAGWGLTNDANHMTGPSRDGAGLARSIEKALAVAGVGADEIPSISAHGTGTPYNDSMEMKAFQRVFAAPRPTWSVKGGMGHTMGAAGLVEAILTGESLRRQAVPPTVRLQEPDDEARGWATTSETAVAGTMALTTNSGFGGVNAAVVVRSPG